MPGFLACWYRLLKEAMMGGPEVVKDGGFVCK